MQKIFFVILSALSVIYTVASHAAQTARYSTNLELLSVPEVKIDGQTYILGGVYLKSNGEYDVSHLIKLEPEQAALVDKINSIPCGSADNLSKLAAQHVFIDGHKSYCLVDIPITTVEGGKIYRYLFIENGTAQVIIDVRDDLFAGCCEFLRSMTFHTMRFGYQSANGFIEQMSLAEIDLSREYILKLSVQNVNDLDY